MSTKNDTEPFTASGGSGAYVDYPTSEGWWWYEYAEAPVQARCRRAYGNVLTVYVRAWLKRDEVKPGWWHGPMTRPPEPPNTEVSEPARSPKD